jgi:hypothetical protein
MEEGMCNSFGELVFLAGLTLWMVYETVADTVAFAAVRAGL